jgi:hypothetical protein
MLERHGLVHHVHLGHGPGLYVLAGRSEREYLYCDRCARVEAVGSERLNPVREELRRTFGYEVRFTHFPIVGLCPSCAAAGGASAGEEASIESAPPGRSRTGEGGHADEHRDRPAAHEHEHSHGDHVHSHPHDHAGGVRHEH